MTKKRAHWAKIRTEKFTTGVQKFERSVKRLKGYKRFKAKVGEVHTPSGTILLVFSMGDKHLARTGVKSLEEGVETIRIIQAIIEK